MRFYVANKTKDGMTVEQKTGDMVMRGGKKVYGYRNSKREYTIVDPMSGIRIGDVPSLNQMSKLDDRKFQEMLNEGEPYRNAVKEFQEALAKHLSQKRA